MVKDPPLWAFWMVPLIESGESDVDVDSFLVPVRTSRDHVADFQPELFSGVLVEQGFHGQIGTGRWLGIDLWLSAGNDIYDVWFVRHCHTLDAAAIALDQRLVILVERVWFSDGGSAWALAQRHQLRGFVHEERPATHSTLIVGCEFTDARKQKRFHG